MNSTPCASGSSIGVVDGVRGAAHVRLPRVRPRLAAAAGLLLAAERAADLRAGGADVDVGDAAVGAVGGEEPLGLALVGGEDRRRQALRARRCAARSPRRSRRRSGRRGSARTSPRAPPRSARASGRARARRSTARLAAVRLRSPPQTTVAAVGPAPCPARPAWPRTRAVRDQRTDERAVVERVADAAAAVGAQRSAATSSSATDGVHDQPAQRGAALPGGARRGEHDAAHGEVEVGGRGDDRRVVAAELEQAAAEARGDPRADRAAHPHRPGGADQRDPRVVDEPLADARRARGPARWTPSGAPTSSAARRSSASQASAVSGVSSDGFHTTVSPQTSAIAVFHDHTATGKLNAEITPTTPSGCQVSISRWPGPLRRHRPAVQLARQPDRELADVDHLLDLAQRLGRDLARLEGDQFGQVRLVLGQQLAEPPDQRAALRGGHRAPLAGRRSCAAVDRARSTSSG